jgi:hypothetical protein
MHRWSIVIVLVLTSNARAQELPSQVDLRAAYCIPILQDGLSEISSLRNYVQSQSLPPEHKAVAEKTLSEAATKTVTNLRRLQLYLLPRLPYLDAYGIGAARKSGEEDIARLKELGKTCDTSCRNMFSNNPSASLSCVIQCNSNSPVRARTNVCDDLSWLPF